MSETYLFNFAYDAFFLAFMFWIVGLVIGLVILSFKTVINLDHRKIPYSDLILALLIHSHLIIASIYAYNFSILPLVIGYFLWAASAAIVFSK